MSKKDVNPLHIEWTPGWVRALNVVTGEQAEAVTLKKLGQITVGQQNAVVGVGRKIVFLKSVRLPKALPDDLRRIIGVQLGQFFPLPPAQLSFDFIQTTNATQEGLLTIVAAMKAEDLKLLQAELKDIGITATRILPTALAAQVIAAKNGMTDALVAETSQGDLSLDVVQSSFLRFSRVTPLSSDHAIEAKRTLAAAGAGALPTIVSGSADIPGAALTLDNSLKVLHEAPPFNFELSESRAVNERKRIAAKTRMALLFVAAALLLAIYILNDRQTAEAQLTAAQALSTKLIAPFKAKDGVASDEAARLIAVQDDLTQAFEPGQHLTDVSALVTDSLPHNAWLTGITLERDKPLQIHGTAMTAGDVAQLVDSLGASNRLKNVKLIFANSASVGTTPVVQFDVTADCVGNLPMPAPAKSGVGGETTYASATSSNEGTGG